MKTNEIIAFLLTRLQRRKKTVLFLTIYRAHARYLCRAVFSQKVVLKGVFKAARYNICI